MSATGEDFEVYRELAEATGGTLLSSVQSVPSLFNFIMASRAKVCCIYTICIMLYSRLTVIISI